MGTFVVDPTSVNSGGWHVSTGTPISVLSGVAGNITQDQSVGYCPCPPGVFQVTGPTTGVINIICTPSNIKLDGNPAIDINSLPSGFNIVSYNVHSKFNISNPAGSPSFGSKTCVTKARILYGQTQIENILPFCDGLNHDIPSSAPFDGNYLTLFGTPWTLEITEYANNITDFGCGLQSYNGALAIVTLFHIEGGYNIIANASTWVINNLTNPGKSFRNGDTGQITSNPSGSYDFSTITQVTIGSTPITTFTIQTPIEVQFIIPPIPPSSPPTIPTTINNPTQFTGQAFVGAIEVLNANASGIYTITSGKTNDTLYLDSQHANETVDTKFPDPFAKTGFIGG